MPDVLGQDVGEDADLGAGGADNLLQLAVVPALRGEGDGQSVGAEPAGPADPVEVSVGVPRDVQVDHQVHMLGVNAPCRQVG